MIISHPWTTWFFLKYNLSYFGSTPLNLKCSCGYIRDLKWYILFWRETKWEGVGQEEGKWAVGFGSVGEKKGGKKEERMSEQKGGLEHNRAWLCHTVHRHDLLTHWALYLLWVAEPLFLEVARTRGSPLRTIQCHQIPKCQWRLYMVLFLSFWACMSHKTNCDLISSTTIWCRVYSLSFL